MPACNESAGRKIASPYRDGTVRLAVSCGECGFGHKLFSIGAIWLNQRAFSEIKRTPIFRSFPEARKWLDDNHGRILSQKMYSNDAVAGAAGCGRG